MRTAANAPVERARPDLLSLALLFGLVFAGGCAVLASGCAAAAPMQYPTTAASLRDDPESDPGLADDRAPQRQPGQVANVAELDHGEPSSDEELMDGELDAVARGE
jgi:hypothetical protein